MNDAKIYSKLGELSLKYEDLGTIIDFRFDRFGLTLSAYTHVTSRPYCYKHLYSYQMINSLPNDYTIEMLCDEFVVEFLAKRNRGANDESIHS